MRLRDTDATFFLFCFCALPCLLLPVGTEPVRLSHSHTDMGRQFRAKPTAREMKQTLECSLQESTMTMFIIHICHKREGNGVIILAFDHHVISMVLPPLNPHLFFHRYIEPLKLVSSGNQHILKAEETV